MNENTLLSLFQESTENYKNDNYQTCIALLNDCLLLSPASPILYSNRAIAHFHIHQQLQAFQDLHSCIQLDHLNYTAYFNLFSLNIINNHNEEAFQNLCLSLSSIYTVLCKNERIFDNIMRALYYGFNNKQALALKGLLHLQRQEYEESIGQLQRALSYERSDKERKKLIKLLKELISKRNRNVNLTDEKLISGDKYRLKTNLQCPVKDNFEIKINQMLKQFNNIYNRLKQNKNNQQKHVTSQQMQEFSRISQNQKSISSFAKEDKQFTRLTAYNSIMINQDLQNHIKQLDLSINTDNSHIIHNSFSKDAQTHNPNHSEVLHSSNKKNSPQNSQKQIVQENADAKQTEKHTLINFKVYYAQILQQCKPQFDRLYAVLNYNLKQNQIFVTPNSTGYNNFYRWDDLSSSLKLADQPCNLQVKIFDKNYIQFEDDLIGRGEVQISQLGIANIPLFDGKNCHTGNIIIGVQLNR